MPPHFQCLATEYCHVVLGNETLLTELKNQNFNLAIVDLIYNECSLVNIYFFVFELCKAVT